MVKPSLGVEHFSRYMELTVDIPTYIRKRAAEKAIQSAYAESDDLRGTCFHLSKSRLREKATLTVPNETAGIFLVHAGRCGRIVIGFTELRPERSKKRPDPNLVKTLLHEQPASSESRVRAPKCGKEIQQLLGDINLGDDETSGDESWEDDDDPRDSKSGKQSSAASRWTSNMPDVNPEDEDQLTDVSIAVREIWFGVWCDNEATKHVEAVRSRPPDKPAMLPSSWNVGLNAFSFIPPEQRGNPTFSPEWNASQSTGKNSYDHPFFEIDYDEFIIKLSADVQIRFFERDIKSVVVHHTPAESAVFITLSQPPIIADTSEITRLHYAKLNRAVFHRLYQVNQKHSSYVSHCRICCITFHPRYTDAISSIFSLIGPSAQSPVTKAPGGLYARKHQDALKKMFASMPLRIALELSALLTWSIMFPTELLAFTKESVVPLIGSRTEDEISQMLQHLRKSPPWEPFKGEPRPNFIKLFERTSRNFVFVREDHGNENYCIVYQLFVTPTGLYVEGPRLEKTNRVFRQYKKLISNFINVTFVEENGGQIARNSLIDIPHDVVYKERFGKMLKEGIKVAGRHYKFLAYSNSSLREGRVLFFTEPADGTVTVDGIREWMGDFSKIKNPARYAARMGQAFTSTTATVRVKKDEVTMRVPDIQRNGYNFSDGIGTISEVLAKDVWKSQNDARAGKNLWKVNHSKESCDEAESRPPSAFQIRFGGAKGMVSVDPRQVITVLQDLGVPKQRFLDLQRRYVKELSTMWDSYEKLVELSGTDGAFGNYVRLWDRLELREMKYKARMVIPNSWHLFGILDETGTLEAGRVFVQIDSPQQSQIIEGPCIIYRSPILHPGDVQPVIAVDCPKLRHLRNVIVFSQFGDRDLPSKLGGGDLDGDMFSIVSDRTFFPTMENFREAAAYEAARPRSNEKPVKIVDIADFVIYFLQNDKLGVLSKRHLALADQLPGGTTNSECLALAELCNHAVDFPKSGIAADITAAPKLLCRPDFMYHPNMEIKTGYYKSTRAQGLMYRDKELNSLLLESYSVGEGTGYKSPDKDSMWIYLKRKSPNWEDFVEEAMGFQRAFEAELNHMASFCNPRLSEIEMWTGFVNLEDRKHERSVYSLESWVKDQFGNLLLKFEAQMAKGKSKPDIRALATASYYVSNVVKGDLEYGNVFGFILFRFFVDF
ncbi:hypothetical protein HDU83_006225 [Entophlyctis luteolus]|nr:hypothetical protein HDU83_006225 [Entophlyctis luteolus]